MALVLLLSGRNFSPEIVVVRMETRPLTIGRPQRESHVKSVLRRVLALIVLVLPGTSLIPPSIASTKPNDSRAEAERMWELAIQAKGGRETLHAVNNVQMSSHEKYLWWFEILTINYEGLMVFPAKSWEWDDQRGTVFGFTIHLHNFEKNIHQSYVDTGNGARVVPIQEPSRRNLTTLQLHLFSETRWVQPIPESFRRDKVDEREVDIVQTRVKALPDDEQKVEFALDRNTHLPVKVIYYWTRNGHELSGGVALKDYVDVSGIKMPAKVGRVRSKYKLNVEYDERIFEQPPSRDAGMDAWKKKP
jgi:hypothetical protein